MRKSLLANRVFNTPLLLDKVKADSIALALTSEIFGPQASVNPAPQTTAIAVPERHCGVLGETGPHLARMRGEQTVPRTANGVGVIAVVGTLVHRGAWIGSESGLTSYQGLMRQVAEAMSDDFIKGVVFEIDSFGGELSGLGDCVAMIAELSAKKPTLSILKDSALSAAYWLASQTRWIVIPEFGHAGSIGVTALHVSYEKALEMDGIEVTVISSGEHKADGNPYEKLPDAVYQKKLAEFEEIRGAFARSVATGRGDRLSAEAALATQAESLPDFKAVRVGLVDEVGLPSVFYDTFVKLF